MTCFPSRLLAAALVLSIAGPGRAAEPSREQVEFFEKKVRPILAERCLGCHSDAGKRKGGLLLDSRAGLLAGGDSGPVVVPGQPDESRLVEAIGYRNEHFRMPPKGRLPDDEIATLTHWVKAGAPWPNAAAAAPRRLPGQITDADRDWWAFRPVNQPAIPEIRNPKSEIRNPIDAFILARLEQAGLVPAPEADRAALVRRVTFDLCGLPPTPQEVDAFLKDSATDAYERLVDRLLESPRYGERMARSWLDLVRYADSDGYRSDGYRPHAWRYRDYVVRAFNADKPYDRFVQEQLAGDELFPGDAEALVATGYLRHWVYEYNNRDARGQWTIILNDVTDTTGDVFLGLGLQCARCHDHKFDPILQKDYYRLQAFFANLLPRDDLVAATEQERLEHARKLKAWEEKTAAIRAEIETIEGPYRKNAGQTTFEMFPDDVQAMMRKPAAQRAPLEQQLAELAYRQVDYESVRFERALKDEDKDRLLALRRKLAEFESLKPPPLPVAFAATDVGPQAPPTVIPKRPNEPIEPGFLTLLDARPVAVTPLPQSSGRRRALAQWLTRADNPLTARVMVNRIWQQHFGRGLAANASDFGRLGEPPTHPELLDYLANSFIQDGWSLKKLHRLIVTSATYRQSALHPQPAPGKRIDPENRLLWRGGVRRLEAEQIRDALFAVTGELDLKAGGPGAAGTEPRRSVYTKVLRNTRDPLLDVFDAPLWFQSAAARDTTTTPVQSLLLINSQLLLQRARAFADRLAREEPDEARRVERAYRLAFGRVPTTEEAARAQAFVNEQNRRIDPKKVASADAAFVSGKIPYHDGQAAEIKLDGEHPGFEVPHSDQMPKADFTVEAFIYPRTVADTAAVRTIAAKWSGEAKEPGWSLGITGRKSQRKPQTVVLQFVGQTTDGTVREEAVFSDQDVALNKPYYLAASVRLATAKEKGEVTFYLKDLSNEDEPPLVAKVPHTIQGGIDNPLPLTIGRDGKGAAFDGLLDDVRLSETALGPRFLLLAREGANRYTIGYWTFEPKPSVFRDATGHGFDIRPAATAPASADDVRRAAWVDFCHVLLNASEFLYVE